MRSVLSAGLLLLLVVTAAAAETISNPSGFGFGRTPSAAEIRAWDIAISPSGEELPNGRGTVAAGGELYALHCAACHGAGGYEGPDHKLVGGRDSLDGADPQKTIGSYWPFATTVFDYIRRAMPFPRPGALTDDEVYAVTAWLLHQNGIVAGDFIADSESLPTVVMPNRRGFIADPRPEQFNHAPRAHEGNR